MTAKLQNSREDINLPYDMVNLAPMAGICYNKHYRIVVLLHFFLITDTDTLIVVRSDNKNRIFPNTHFFQSINKTRKLSIKIVHCSIIIPDSFANIS